MSYSIAKGLSFPLGLNTLDHARENEIRLQLYQRYKQGRIYRWGQFDYFFQFKSRVCGYLYEFSQVFPTG